MESLNFYQDSLESVRCRAERLTAAGLSLDTLFAGELTRLSREDEASRLEGVYHGIVEQFERVKSSESSASYAQSQINLEVSVIALAMSAGRAMVSKGNRMSTFSNSLKSVSIEKLPFSNVLVGIGPKGLPDDVEVISISRLGRESKRPESDVINELQEHGYLLINEETFSHLVDRLITDIKEGRLVLPVSRDKLSETRTLSEWKPLAKNLESPPVP